MVGNTRNRRTPFSPRIVATWILGVTYFLAANMPAKLIEIVMLAIYSVGRAKTKKGKHGGAANSEASSSFSQNDDL